MKNTKDEDDDDNNNDNNNNNKASSPPTIVFVTAVSQNHMRVAQRDILNSLQQELFDGGEATKHYDRRSYYFKANMTIHDLDFPFDIKVILYDLDYQKKTMQQKEKVLWNKYPFVEYRRFDYQSYPPHVNISADAYGAYAWKPAIIKQVVEEQRQYFSSRMIHSPSLVYWVDAGTVIIPNACNKLNRDLEFALEHGIYTPENSWVSRWTHPDTANHTLIQLDPALYADRSTLMCSANTILVDAKNDTIWDNILTRWNECAMDPSCIAPPGSNVKTNHRYDQAVLSALMAKHGIPAPNRGRRCIKRGSG